MVSIDTIFLLMERPSYRELNKKIALAKNAYEAETFSFLEPDVTAADLLDIGILVNDLPGIFPHALNEITPRHYKGNRPPQRSYKDPILDEELFAFRWDSKAFGYVMYFKFALKSDYLWIASLHKDR
jgi:hypothetical protein